MKILERENEKIVFNGTIRITLFDSGCVGFLDLKEQTSFTISKEEVELFKDLLCCNKQIKEEYDKVVVLEMNTFRTGYIQALSWVLELSKQLTK